MITRRVLGWTLAGAAAAATLGMSATSALATDIVVKVGVDLPLTGAYAQGAREAQNLIMMAVDEANESHSIPGYRIEAIVYDDATSTTHQPDPAQSATNARRMVLDTDVVAAVGPMGSGLAKAMLPILSVGNLATVTPRATNPDLTAPRFAAAYRPAGKTVFFRAVTTDAYQGPNLANFFTEVLKVRSVYVLDDGTAYGIGIADSFEAQAAKKGISVLGRDRLDPQASDYAAVLTKIKLLNSDALYYGGDNLAGFKLAKQSHELLPAIIRGAGDGMFSKDFLIGAGFPAAEGWYITLPQPHMTDSSQAQSFVQRCRDRIAAGGCGDNSITTYDAALVVIDAIKRVVASGSPVTRDAVRNAIQSTHLETIQGPVSFDENGDLSDRSISVYQIRRDDNKPLDSVLDQSQYVGAAPQS